MQEKKVRTDSRQKSITGTPIVVGSQGKRWKMGLLFFVSGKELEKLPESEKN